MATKERRRQARELVEALEVRVHAGPPPGHTEIQSVRDFLREHDFSGTSDYFSRLALIQNRVVTRPVVVQSEKRNYGGEAGGHWMQLQSVHDHVILSTCHAGEFNTQRGRVKISHRFNQAGRIDFVELKFLRSLQPWLNGAIRKLLTVKGHQDLPKAWHEAEAFALRVLPRELVFVHENVFRYAKDEIFAWLINLGHWTVTNLLEDLQAQRVNGCVPGDEGNSSQLCLKSVVGDEIAMPILEQAAALESMTELDGDESVVIRYVHK